MFSHLDRLETIYNNLYCAYVRVIVQIGKTVAGDIDSQYVHVLVSESQVHGADC